MKRILLALLMLQGCVSKEVFKEETKTEVTQQKVEPSKRIALSWESTTEPHPERAPWSDYLIQKLREDFAVYDQATDMVDLCPKYKSLNETDKLKAWGEFFVALAYFESTYNPKSASVDVGSASKKDTWSIGLFQVSVVDQSWAGGNTKYSYDELLTAKPNIHLATLLIRRQIKNTKLIVLPNSSKYRYFATILSGNKYSKVSDIKARMKRRAPKCHQ